MTSTPPLADPGPPPPAPAGVPRGSDRFFAWVAGLGVSRADGWLGGVCAGVAARLRIDPLIVRGVVVVAALFGLPLLFVYAVAWALLPDVDGRIHLRELFHGRFDPAIVGIGIMLLLGFIPVVPWTLQLFAPAFWVFSPGPFGGFGFFGTLLVLAVAGTLVYFIVRGSRRSAPRGPAADPRTASADPAGHGTPDAAAETGRAAASGAPGTDASTVADAAPEASVPALEAEALAADAFAAAPDSVAFAPAPQPDGAVRAAAPARPAGADDAEVAAWRARHAEWKTQDDAWRRQQQDAERAAREQARRERQIAGAAFAAEADERRRARRASKPRTSFAYVATFVGLALISGAIAGLSADAHADSADVAVAIGLFAAALVAAIGMIVAGIARRRSGFLTFVTIALLVSAVSTTAATATPGVLIGSASITNVEGPFTVRQPFGSLAIGLVETTPLHPIVVEKALGATSIVVNPGVKLDLHATLGSGVVHWTRSDADPETGVWEGTRQADGSTLVDRRILTTDSTDVGTQSVTIDQASGDIYITIYDN